MTFDYFVEVPLLWTAFFIFIISLLVRVVVFVVAILKSKKQKTDYGPSAIMVIFRSFAPLHISALEKPFYTFSRYTFHICLFVVPIWLTGHVEFWSESIFGWEWMTLPDQWADWMTLFVLCFIVYFFMRRILFTEDRHQSSTSDFALLIITAAPFLSGYFLTHGTPDILDFMNNHMWIIHILSGEIMLVSSAFLFCRTRLNKEKCTGCVACASNCPTDAVVFNNEGEIRNIYSFISRCICCGACVTVCPEEAAVLRHEMSIRNFLRLFSGEKIQSIELTVCEGCGAPFAPGLLLGRVEKSLVDDYRHYCSTCKKGKLAANFYKIATWAETLLDEDLKNETTSNTINC